MTHATIIVISQADLQPDLPGKLLQKTSSECMLRKCSLIIGKGGRK